MEALTDLREARYESVNGDRAGTEKRAAREWTAGREEYPTEYQLHYQEDYGTTMSDDQYTKLNEGQATFKASVASAKGKVEDSRAEVQTLYNQQNQKLDASLQNLPATYDAFSSTLLNNQEWVTSVSNGYAPLSSNLGNANPEDALVTSQSGSVPGFYLQERIGAEYVDHLNNNPGFVSFYNNWAANNAVKVYVRDPKHPEYNKDFYVMPDAANSLAALDFQGYGVAYRNADGSVTVGSDTYAAQIKKQLDTYEQQLYKSLGAAYTPAVYQNVASGKSALNNEYTIAGESLASQQRQIAAKEEENLSSLNLIRSTYAKKLSNMSASIGSMNYAKSN